MKQLYERYFYNRGYYVNESVWCIRNSVVRVEIAFADRAVACAQVLTRNGDWADLERQRNLSAIADLWHEYDGDDKTAPPAEIIAAFQEDRDELLRLCGLLLDGGDQVINNCLDVAAVEVLVARAVERTLRSSDRPIHV